MKKFYTFMAFIVFSGILYAANLALVKDSSTNTCSQTINFTAAQVNGAAIATQAYSNELTGTSANTANQLVRRDSSGNFSAGTITATLSGNASGSSGSCTGNAATATKLATARAINGVDFDGSAAISVPSNIAPGTAGNVLTSDGAGAWTSAAPTGGGDTISPATNTDSYIPQWDGANSKTLKNGLATGNSSGNVVVRSGSNEISADTISEVTAGNGVSVDGVKLKDEEMTLENNKSINSKTTGGSQKGFWVLDSSDIMQLGDAAIAMFNRSLSTTYGHHVMMTDETKPGTPASGYISLYCNGDKLFWKNDSGTEYDLSAAGSGTDSNAIHKNTANEISTITEKTSLADNDLFLIEDSADSGAKKKVKKSNLGSGGGATISDADRSTGWTSTTAGVSQRACEQAMAAYSSDVEYAIFADQKTAGTNGGTFTSGAWRTRTLNTTYINEITGCSLGSNQVTLSAGTYYIRASASVYNAEIHRLQLYNVTDATTAVLGTCTGCALPDSANHAYLEGVITIAGTKVFELQHRCSYSANNVGMGYNSGYATEVYATLYIGKR